MYRRLLCGDKGRNYFISLKHELCSSPFLLYLREITNPDFFMIIAMAGRDIITQKKEPSCRGSSFTQGSHIFADHSVQEFDSFCKKEGLRTGRV
jgi:hypothetical protein